MSGYSQVKYNLQEKLTQFGLRVLTDFDLELRTFSDKIHKNFWTV